MRYIFAACITLFVMGIVLVILGFQDRALAAKCSAVPEEISLEDLINRGPDSNPHIVLKDFSLCENYVYQTNRGVWQHAYVPVVPRQGANHAKGGSPTNFKALIFCDDARNEAELIQRCGQPRLRALMINRLRSPTSKERDLLAQKYPGTDFSRCLIIHEGQQPPGPTRVMAQIGGGALILVLGLGGGVIVVGLWLYTKMAGPRVRSRRRRRQEEDDEDND